MGAAVRDNHGQADGWQLRALAAMFALVAVIAAALIAGTGVSLADYIGVASAFLRIGLIMAIFIGIVGRLPALLRLSDRPAATYWPWILATVLLIGFTMPTYNLFKQLVLPLRGYPYDATLAAIGHALFLGHDPWRVTHALFPQLGFLLFVDRLYTLWLLVMYAFPTLTVVLIADGERRVRLLACWLLSWVVIGGIGAWVLGSAGPAYYTTLIGPSRSFGDLVATLHQARVAAIASGSDVAAVDFQSVLLQLRQSGHFAFAGGISAAPSMHVAMATLFAIGGFQVRRWLGWLMVGYATIIWIGSIHLGWHYAVDGLISAPMMLAIWAATGWATAAARRRTAPTAAPLAEPAPA